MNLTSLQSQTGSSFLVGAVLGLAWEVPVVLMSLDQVSKMEEENGQEVDKQVMTQEAPVFYPTEEEFADPLGYVAKIRPKAEEAGICRVVPPAGWKPPFSLDTATFKFPTRAQNISRLGAAARLSRDFEKKLRKFMFKRGTPLAGPVKLGKEEDGIPVDLYRLYKTVKNHGGYDAVGHEVMAWEAIAQEAEIPVEYSKQLQKEYLTSLLPFEKMDGRKEGELVRQSRSMAMRMRQHLRDESKDSAAEDSDAEETEDVDVLQLVQETHKSPTAASSRSRTSSSSSPRSAASSFSSSEASTKKKRDLIGKRFVRYFPPQDCYMEGVVTGLDHHSRFTVRYTGEGKGPKIPKPFTEGTSRRELLVLIANGDSKPHAKAVQFQDFCESCLRTSMFGPMTECYSCGALRHAPCMEPLLKSLPHGDWFCPDCTKEGDGGAKEEAAAEQGKEQGKASRMGGRMSPVQEDSATSSKKPSSSSSSWSSASAPPVESLMGSFGFEDGATYTLPSFEKMAKEWREDYFMRHFGRTDLTEEEVEQEFWRVIDGGEVQREEDDDEEDYDEEEESSSSSPKAKKAVDNKKGRSRAPQDLKVEYGSELDTGTYGSAFPLPASVRNACSDAILKSPGTSETKIKYPEGGFRIYQKSGWNINNLPVVIGSMLHHLDVPVTGVVVPWLYVGMTLSAFCWHAEDHYLYSINYLHQGTGAKAWYGIPGTYADAFEALVEELFPELFERNPDLMLQLVTMINPRLIVSRGIPVYRATQRTGQFIITFPQAYHAGFNHGFNVAEAVNFAPPDFLPWGGKAQELYRRLHRSPVFSQDQLVVAAARALLATPAKETAECLPFLILEFKRMIAASCRRAAAAKELGVENFQEGAKELILSLEVEEEENGAVESNDGGEGSMRRRVAPASVEQAVTPVKRRGRPPKHRPGPLLMTPNSSSKKPQVRHGLLKGPRCAVCKQYCFLEQIHCTSPSCGSHRSVCGEHVSEACVNGCPTSTLIYRRRCPENVLINLLDCLNEREKALEKWQEELLDAGFTTTTTVKATSASSTSEEENGGSSIMTLMNKTKRARDVKFEDYDPPVKRICLLASAMQFHLEEAEWHNKPTLARLMELMKKGKDLGVRRHDLVPLESTIKAAQGFEDALLACLPQGALRKSHMRLSHQRRLKDDGEGGEAAAAQKSSVSVEDLTQLALSALKYPVRLEKAVGVILRLLGEGTRVRRAAWELLGVKTADDFAALDYCLSRAEALLPEMMTKNPAITDLLTSVSQGGGPRLVTAKGGKRVSAVKGRWEGRRFHFLPSAEVRRLVMRLEKELEVLSIDAPEVELLDKGYMEKNEEGGNNDFEYDEEQMMCSIRAKPLAKKMCPMGFVKPSF